MSPPPKISTRSIPNVPSPELTLENNNVLHFSGADGNGKTHKASFDLDSILGNVNGALSLGGSGFSGNAHGVSVTRLSKYQHSVDAQLPDSNGHVSTSSMRVLSKVGTVGGQKRLLMAWRAPHSTVHANSQSTDEADQKILSQMAVKSPNYSIVSVTTLGVDPKYNMDNPNREWVKQNLGPHGSSGSGAEWGEGAVEGGAEVGMECAADAMEGCIIL